MAQLFGRRVVLTVAVPTGQSLNDYSADVIELSDLDFEFSVKKSLGKEPNTAEISVYNLSEQSRAALQSRSLRVTLQAGYQDTVATIFVGDSRDIDSTLDGSDWVTTIQLGDGERGYRWGHVNESFREGVSVIDVVRKLADRMQLDSTAVSDLAALRGKQYVSGYTAYGRSARELDRILKGYGLEWSIQDGKLQILQPDTATTETLVELSRTSGMLGAPTLNTPEGASRVLNPFTASVETRRGKGKPTLKVKSLLQPEIRPGRRITVDSVTGIKGTFRVTAIEHRGQTWGGPWETQIEASPV